MVRRFFASNDAFNGEFAQFLEQERGTGEDVANTVTGILKDVQARGGEAVAEYTARFDGLQLDPSTLTSDNVNLHSLAAQCPADLREAIDFAHDRIATYHAAQRPADHSFTDSAGVELGWRWTALESVGVYVPGGRASYPSSVLMNVVPAKIAGVERIVMVAPAPQGELSPAVAYAALKAGVEEFYPIGGAQAVGALAFGTATIPAVDKIVGPGNIYVAEAKRQVFGKVGIDMIAGPSEILVVCDGKTDPDWIAMDLFSQAEHDEEAQAILVSPDGDFLQQVAESMEKLAVTLERETIIRTSMKNRGAMIQVQDLQQAIDLANTIASEHLELSIDDAEQWAKQIRHAGAIFLGRHTPEALGDYCAGPNHVLPTSATARFSSPLGVYDFQKRSSLIGCSPEGASELAKIASPLARGESLTAHARSAEYRIKKASDA